MRTLIVSIAVAAALSILSGGARAQSADDAFGVWQHPENGSHVEMAKCGEGLCAKIVKITDAQATDDKNPDAAKRGQPIVGLTIMDNAAKTGANAWSGKLYDRTSGKSYNGTITVKSKDSIDLSGCALLVFCKTVTWTRVKAAAVPPA